jgi:uncharacterized protein YqeY
MSLSVKIMDLKTAESQRYSSTRSLRAIKSEILLAQTASGSKEEITEDDEVKLLQRLVKPVRKARILQNKTVWIWLNQNWHK